MKIYQEDLSITNFQRKFMEINELLSTGSLVDHQVTKQVAFTNSGDSDKEPYEEEFEGLAVQFEDFVKEMNQIRALHLIKINYKYNHLITF